MGIDVYLEWDDMTKEEKQAQCTGFSAVAGDVGYLREAYHGGPYATRIIAREAFESDNCVAEIPAAIMRERLSNVTEPAYNVNGGHKIAAKICDAFKKYVGKDAAPTVLPDTTRPMTVEEAVRERCATLYPDIDAELVEQKVQAYKDFVALAEAKERQTGKPCRVIASY